MNNILKQRFSNLAITTVFALSAWSLDGLTSAVEAQQFSPAQLQQVKNGFFRSRPEEFFQEGERRLDREIELLTHRRLTPVEDLLKVPAEFEIEAETAKFNNPSGLLEDGNLSGSGLTKPAEGIRE